MQSSEGRRLLQAGIVEDGTGRLKIVKPLLTDAVHRSVIDLEPPIVSEESDA